MALPESRFDGVFANASLFHVPSQELPRVLLELSETLKPRGVLFCSNPRGNNEEGFSGGRCSCFFDLDTWRNYVRAA
jgi:2-polyprenyl-3-methyl-5-hydroxy-6-metoxy-1,4-benzoquinol methylase